MNKRPIDNLHNNNLYSNNANNNNNNGFNQFTSNKSIKSGVTTKSPISSTTSFQNKSIISSHNYSNNINSLNNNNNFNYSNFNSNQNNNALNNNNHRFPNGVVYQTKILSNPTVNTISTSTLTTLLPATNSSAYPVNNNVNSFQSPPIISKPISKISTNPTTSPSSTAATTTTTTSTNSTTNNGHIQKQQLQPTTTSPIVSPTNNGFPSFNTTGQKVLGKFTGSKQQQPQQQQQPQIQQQQQQQIQQQNKIQTTSLNSISNNIQNKNNNGFINPNDTNISKSKSNVNQTTHNNHNKYKNKENVQNQQSIIKSAPQFQNNVINNRALNANTISNSIGSNSSNSSSSSSSSGSDSGSNSSAGHTSGSSNSNSNGSKTSSNSGSSASQFEFEFAEDETASEFCDELQSSQFSSFYDQNTSQNRQQIEDEFKFNLDDQSQDPHHSQLLLVPFNNDNNNNNNAKQSNTRKFVRKKVDPTTVSQRIEDCCKQLFDLPEMVSNIYIRRGIKTLYDWQKECLTDGNLLDGSNLIYSLPTSGGKTLVAEIILLRSAHLQKKKCLFIFPFVSIVTEKAESLVEFGQQLKFSVDAYYGIQGVIPVPPGNGIVVCTIEKANIIVNQMIEDKRMSEIGTVVIDELHMIGDGERGVLLEMLISKILFVTKGSVQVVGMSATIPNLAMMQRWFRGGVYEKQFRPVKLEEFVRFEEKIYAKPDGAPARLEESRQLEKGDNLVHLVKEVTSEGHSVLVFCHTIELTVSIAKKIATALPEERQVKKDEKDILLRNLGAATFPNADDNLKATVPSGVAFHNSTLTNDEREIIEQGFKERTLNVLCATSTLSAGVNLPAKRVIIRTPKMGYNFISTRLYKQMAGRAGRAGIDTSGESYLYCTDKREFDKAKSIITSDLEPVVSGLNDNPRQFQKIVLECISSGIANNIKIILEFFSCTFYCCNIIVPQAHKKLTALEYLTLELTNTLNELEKSGFIQKQKPKTDGIDHFGYEEKPMPPLDTPIEDVIWEPTGLGAATFKSSLSTDQARVVMKDLLANQAKGIILIDELQLCFITTPMFGLPFMKAEHWVMFKRIYQSIQDSKKEKYAIAKIIGISGDYIDNKANGDSELDQQTETSLANLHCRFYVAMALCDLIQENPLSVVSARYKLGRGTLQNLMQSSGSFAWMVVGQRCQTGYPAAR
ncbi:hypothetical protein PPL_05648 [Heterostelium album PN500]|uniref:DNA-directed DNA polymerase n=1 Tax=Heterostelium pallidum (strain ATCC 26659 / Pp 5 / PN500) TaxID=670386 RepID=D3BAR7_HETP5|nr:hypothetical protein PPL_05648 [Heterostelium album PN500]EFA81654.1 hypothetical protein PPL_05648 [Heterostelium album PN500]|eukprot:XP_020433771.1 hypothetical protein PPL_05648 [Heterostelium album PN500]